MLLGHWDIRKDFISWFACLIDFTNVLLEYKPNITRCPIIVAQNRGDVRDKKESILKPFGYSIRGCISLETPTNYRIWYHMRDL